MSPVHAGTDVFPAADSEDEMIIPPPTGLKRAELFDHIAREHGGFAFMPDDAARLAVLRRRLGKLRGQHLVEPGCGAGHLTEHLAGWTGPNGRVVAFDSSASMIELARDRTAGQPQVTATCAALEIIELPPGAFDCVVCFRVWPHFEDGELALRRISRWLRSAGRLVIAHWAGRAKLAALHATHHAVVEDVFPPQRQLEAAMRRHGLLVREWIETADEIYVDAIREG